MSLAIKKSSLTLVIVIVCVVLASALIITTVLILNNGNKTILQTNKAATSYQQCGSIDIPNSAGPKQLTPVLTLLNNGVDTVDASILTVHGDANASYRVFYASYTGKGGTPVWTDYKTITMSASGTATYTPTIPQPHASFFSPNVYSFMYTFVKQDANNDYVNFANTSTGFTTPDKSDASNQCVAWTYVNRVQCHVLMHKQSDGSLVANNGTVDGSDKINLSINWTDLNGVPYTMPVSTNPNTLDFKWINKIDTGDMKWHEFGDEKSPLLTSDMNYGGNQTFTKTEYSLNVYGSDSTAYRIGPDISGGYNQPSCYGVLNVNRGITPPVVTPTVAPTVAPVALCTSFSVKAPDGIEVSGSQIIPGIYTVSVNGANTNKVGFNAVQRVSDGSPSTAIQPDVTATGTTVSGTLNLNQSNITYKKITVQGYVFDAQNQPVFSTGCTRSWTYVATDTTTEPNRPTAITSITADKTQIQSNGDSINFNLSMTNTSTFNINHPYIQMVMDATIDLSSISVSIVKGQNNYKETHSINNGSLIINLNYYNSIQPNNIVEGSGPAGSLSPILNSKDTVGILVSVKTLHTFLTDGIEFFQLIGDDRLDSESNNVIWAVVPSLDTSSTVSSTNHVVSTSVPTTKTTLPNTGIFEDVIIPMITGVSLVLISIFTLNKFQSRSRRIE